MATKKSTNEFLDYIRDNDFKAARKALKAKPDLVHATCAPPPAKYEGQTLLQIAVRNPTPKIVTALIDAGADVNYMEKTRKNPWNSPVLHDAIDAVLMHSIGEKHATLKAMVANVRRLLDEGADPNKKDSRKATAFDRYIKTVKARTKDIYFVELPSMKPRTDQDSIKRGAYLKEMYDLLIEYGVKPVGISKLNKTQRERLGI